MDHSVLTCSQFQCNVDRTPKTVQYKHQSVMCHITCDMPNALIFTVHGSRSLCYWNTAMYQTSSSDKQWRGHRVCSGRGCNRGLGAEPPAGSRGRAPGQRVRGRSPSEPEEFSALRRQRNLANLPPSKYLVNCSNILLEKVFVSPLS